jgi:endoribonuclease Dicer
MFIVFPAIIHRIEEYLIALEAVDIVGITINPALALEACTKDSDNNEEHSEERINFRSGMGPNYERLEFMGDCFLKMATSIALYGLNPNDNEFESHVNRMVMICNKNLFNTAKVLNMPEYVRSLAFSR